MQVLHPGVPFLLGESDGRRKVDVIEPFGKRLSVARLQLRVRIFAANRAEESVAAGREFLPNWATMKECR
jgi:hypothetical protein